MNYYHTSQDKEIMGTNSKTAGLVDLCDDYGQEVNILLYKFLTYKEKNLLCFKENLLHSFNMASEAIGLNLIKKTSSI